MRYRATFGGKGASPVKPVTALSDWFARYTSLYQLSLFRSPSKLHVHLIGFHHTEAHAHHVAVRNGINLK